MSLPLKSASYTAGSFQIIIATTTFTWSSTVSPWTDTNLYRLYAWKKIFYDKIYMNKPNSKSRDHKYLQYT